MEYSADPARVTEWAPLLMEGRGSMPVAATKMDGGTDVNFGDLSRKLIAWLGEQDGCAAATGQRVVDLDETRDGWQVTVRDEATRETRTVTSKFVFVGAGGGSLPLLQKSGISEAKGFGGFPVYSDQLLAMKMLSKTNESLLADSRAVCCFKQTIDVGSGLN
jgi:malate dehydrogenase (quinone)